MKINNLEGSIKESNMDETLETNKLEEQVNEVVKGIDGKLGNR